MRILPPPISQKRELRHDTVQSASRWQPGVGWQPRPEGLTSVEEVCEDWDLGVRAASREFSPNASIESHPYLLGSIRVQESWRAAI